HETANHRRVSEVVRVRIDRNRQSRVAARPAFARRPSVVRSADPDIDLFLRKRWIDASSVSYEQRASQRLDRGARRVSQSERPNPVVGCQTTMEGIVQRHSSVAVEAKDLPAWRRQQLRNVGVEMIAGTDEKLARAVEHQCAAMMFSARVLRILIDD